MTESISKNTYELINNYLNLPLPIKIKCPYHNNRRSKVKAGLRVLVGKGFPSEIVDEVNLISLREKIDLKTLSKENLTKFLVDHNVGVDCSGFVFWILDTELKSRNLGSLSQNILIAKNKNFLRRIISRLRPAENVGVRTLSLPENSSPVKIDAIKPADLIVMIGEDKDGRPHDHILIVTEVTKDSGKISLIKYAHSIDWAEDGIYGTGVSTGEIVLNQTLADSIWIERGLEGEKNPTLIRSRKARILEFRRLNVLK